MASAVPFFSPWDFCVGGEAHCRSLGLARDDKGRAVTDLQFRESDDAEELPIRLTDDKVSDHSPLVIPSQAEGSAVRLAPDAKIP